MSTLGRAGLPKEKAASLFTKALVLRSRGERPKPLKIRVYVADRTMAPKDIRKLIHWTYESVTLPGWQKGLRTSDQVKDLERGRIP